MNFLITGGNFNNKGAQAMTYISVSELKMKYPNCDITMADVCYEACKDVEHLKFSHIPDGLLYHIYCGGNAVEQIIAKVLLKLKGIKNKKDYRLKDFKNSVMKADAIIDVSGYSVGSNLSKKVNLTYLYALKMAKRNRKKLFLLPQSFGPFEYRGIYGVIMKNGLKKYLRSAELIFAREQAGYNLLQKKFGLSNVILSTDMVLQNKSIDYTLVTRNSIEMKRLVNKTKQYVGIIPSDNNYIFSNKDKIDQYYKEIINSILKDGEKVVLAYHSGNDRKICKRIKDMFPDNEDVILLDQELEFYEFEKLLETFKYMISSRYHSIVLAYKHSVPCIIFAWAVKYQELADFFDQTQYVFHMGKISDSNSIIQACHTMLNKFKHESTKIGNRLIEAQKNNCFDKITEIV